MIFRFPVIDRSSEDIDKMKKMQEKGWQNLTEEEKEEWKKGLRASLNLNDIQRVQSNIELIDKIMGLGLTVTKIDGWYVDSAIFSQIEYNLKKESGKSPEQPYNTFEKWNEIEILLKDTFKMIYDSGIIEKDKKSNRLSFRVGGPGGLIK